MKLSQAVTAISLVAALFVVTGCSSSSAESVSEPPSASHTAAASNSPGQEELYEQAVGIYRNMRVQMEEIERAGGADELPPELDQYVEGFLAETLTGTYRQWKRDQMVLYGRAETDVWVREDSDGQVEGSLVSVAVCSDGRQAQIKKAGVPMSSGVVGINYYAFKYFSGELKAFDVEYEVIDSCADR